MTVHHTASTAARAANLALTIESTELRLVLDEIVLTVL